jgi:hypothetical protein
VIVVPWREGGGYREEEDRDGASIGNRDHGRNFEMTCPWTEVPPSYAMLEQGPTPMLAIRFPLLISFVSCPKPSSSKTSFHSSLWTSLTPRRLCRPRFLLCRNIPPPLIPKSPLSRPYNPYPGEPRIPPNHPSIWILR